MYRQFFNVNTGNAIPYSTEYTCRRETPKYPEGSVYSGLIKSKSKDVGQLRGFPKVLVSFLMRENRAFTCTQLAGIKWLLMIWDP